MDDHVLLEDSHTALWMQLKTMCHWHRDSKLNGPHAIRVLAADETAEDVVSLEFVKKGCQTLRDTGLKTKCINFGTPVFDDEEIQIPVEYTRTQPKYDPPVEKVWRINVFIENEEVV